MYGKFTFAVMLIAGIPLAANAQTILSAAYDPTNDQLVVEIAYRGTTPEHQFRLQWDKCRPGQGGAHTTAARLIDIKGNEGANKDYKVRSRLSLSGLDCRPEAVTLRLGPVSNVTVHVPANAKKP